MPQDLGPMLTAGNIHYDISDRSSGMLYGGIGVVQMLVKRLKLAEAIDRRVRLFKLYNPYHESDHVLNIAYNLLCKGECLEDIERLRNDEVYLDAVGADRIPDPTTAGDFCRRFQAQDVERLQEVINDVRLKVWRQQGPEFFAEAILDADGTIAATTGECKRGMDISHKGDWGYHVLIISLANTGEPLYLVNRGGNRPSHEGAAARLDQAIALCRAGGFKDILLRGDTDFTQTAHLDRWHDQGVRFVFGIDAMPNLIALADSLPETAFTPLIRPAKYQVKTQCRQRPEHVKERIVREREFKNIRLMSEHVAEFNYSPTKSRKTYRVVVVRKNLSVEKGDQVLFDDIRYFFYITNIWRKSTAVIVASANHRCNQENLIDQLKNGVRALRMPVDNLVSNWAYMVMASLAWNLKAWYALLLPASGRWHEKHAREKHRVLRMEFKTFCNFFMMLPCQIAKTGRKLVYRLLGWNEYLAVFFRAVGILRHPLRC
jgi:hypothetical protein